MQRVENVFAVYLLQSLREVELDSTSRSNACCSESVAIHVNFRGVKRLHLRHNDKVTQT